MSRADIRAVPTEHRASIGDGSVAMIGIVVVSHGDLASALVRAAEMIAGPQERLFAVDIGPDDSAEALAATLDAVLRSIEPEPALMLVDLLGGTPYNVAARRGMDRRRVCVAGVNLPMLLEIVVSRGDRSVADLAALAERVGRESIRNLGPLLSPV